MKILAVILFLGIILSSCGNKATLTKARRSVMRAIFRATARRTI